jgi:hypothetical protein
LQYTAQVVDLEAGRSTGDLATSVGVETLGFC